MGQHRLKFIVTLSVVCVAAVAARAQASQYRCDCSMGEARKIQSSFDNILESRLYCFVYSFSQSRCKNSTEYMQFANPLLFDILTHNPTALINILRKYPELDNSALHYQLQHPLLDFNINKVSYTVDTASRKSKMKQKILADLDAVDVDEKGYPR